MKRSRDRPFSFDGLGARTSQQKMGSRRLLYFPPSCSLFFYWHRSFSSVSSSSVAYTGIKREEEEASLPHFSLAFERKDEGGREDIWEMGEGEIARGLFLLGRKENSFLANQQDSLSFFRTDSGVCRECSTLSLLLLECDLHQSIFFTFSAMRSSSSSSRWHNAA